MGTRCTAIFGAIALFLAFSTAGWAQNLVPNPDFRRGLENWKVRFEEPNETKYARNHEWIEVVADPHDGGRCIQFALTPAVAASEGVKAVTPLIEIETGVDYEFGADVMTLGPAVKIMLEGYYVDPEQTAAGGDNYPGFRRIYRKVIHARGATDSWKPFYQDISPPARYQPTHVVVKLYAYHPAGQVMFRNVRLSRTQGEK